MNASDPISRLFAGHNREGVEYVLVGRRAVRLNGFVRGTEVVDLVVAGTRENGERVKHALAFPIA